MIFHPDDPFILEGFFPLQIQGKTLFTIFICPMVINYKRCTKGCSKILLLDFCLKVPLYRQCDHFLILFFYFTQHWVIFLFLDQAFIKHLPESRLALLSSTAPACKSSPLLRASTTIECLQKVCLVHPSLHLALLPPFRWAHYGSLEVENDLLFPHTLSPGKDPTSAS